MSIQKGNFLMLCQLFAGAMTDKNDRTGTDSVECTSEADIRIFIKIQTNVTFNNLRSLRF